MNTIESKKRKIAPRNPKVLKFFMQKNAMAWSLTEQLLALDALRSIIKGFDGDVLSITETQTGYKLEFDFAKLTRIRKQSVWRRLVNFFNAKLRG